MKKHENIGVGDLVSWRASLPGTNEYCVGVVIDLSPYRNEKNSDPHPVRVRWTNGEESVIAWQNIKILARAGTNIATNIKHEKHTNRKSY
jgi:hypothetical protein